MFSKRLLSNGVNIISEDTVSLINLEKVIYRLTIPLLG
jgi:hypothetical protein